MTSNACQNLRSILTAAVQSGQVDPQADLEIAITMMLGSLYAAYMAGTPTGRGWPQRVIDAWLGSNDRLPDATSRPQRGDDCGEPDPVLAV